MRVYVGCVGCEQRRIDAQRVVNYFKANGAKIVESPKDCDHAIVITCAVDSSNEEKSISKLADIARELPTGIKVTVGGCLPAISPSRLADYPIDGTFSPRDMESLDAKFHLPVLMENIFRPNISGFDPEIQNMHGLAASPREEYENSKRGFKIVIDDGCLLNCSYCMIKKATGKLKSVDQQVILRQIMEAVLRGERTIMLVGGDTGAYGKEIKTGLHHLLKDIASVPGDFRLFIHDFNVNWLIRDAEEYLAVFSSVNGQRIRGISFPIQSGSDRILTLMKRLHKAESAARVLKLVRLNSPHINLGTHIMIGFPSETNADFEATFGMLEYVGFDFITCFPYSEHPLADSAAITGKIEPEIVEARIARLSSVFGDRIKIMR